MWFSEVLGSGLLDGVSSGNDLDHNDLTAIACAGAGAGAGAVEPSPVCLVDFDFDLFDFLNSTEMSTTATDSDETSVLQERMAGDPDGDLLFDTFLNSTDIEASQSVVASLAGTATLSGVLASSSNGEKMTQVADDSFDFTEWDMQMVSTMPSPSPTPGVSEATSTVCGLTKGFSCVDDSDLLNSYLPTPAGESCLELPPLSPFDMFAESPLESSPVPPSTKSFDILDPNIDFTTILSMCEPAAGSPATSGMITPSKTYSTFLTETPLIQNILFATPLSPSPSDHSSSPSPLASRKRKFSEEIEGAADEEDPSAKILAIKANPSTGLYHCPHPGCTYEGASRRYNLKIHYLTHLGNASKKFICDHCEKPFRRRYDLDRHGVAIHKLSEKDAMANGGPRKFRKPTLQRFATPPANATAKNASPYKRVKVASPEPSSGEEDCVAPAAKVSSATRRSTRRRVAY
ncbi:hypothetical protein HDU97_009015 [Phlyctochytrium planicorne]|nr:hypothetical protein HDU97_009015 [Phlyctochytrium planicorne]